MSDSAELDDVHAAVCADPGEDAPRLAWADLVERLHPNDQEKIDRARYVRLCVRDPGNIDWRHKDHDWLAWINRHSLPRWQMREVTTLFDAERQAILNRAVTDPSAYRELRDLDVRSERHGGYKAIWHRGWVYSLEMGAIDYARMHKLLHQGIPLTRLVLDATGVPNPLVAITVAHAIAGHERTLREVRFFGGARRSREDLSRLTLEASPALADGRVSFAEY